MIVDCPNLVPRGCARGSDGYRQRRQCSYNVAIEAVRACRGRRPNKSGSADAAAVDQTMTATVITGSSRGIGLELCRRAAARGDDVLALCRTPSAQLEQLGVRVIDGVDVGSDESVRDLPARLDGVEIGILINNAGVLSRQSLDSLDMSEIRRQFEVNSLGPLRVTQALLPRLATGAKVAIVTSRMGSITDNTSGGHYGYRMSKAAVNIAGMSLSRDLRQRGVAVILLHPGYVNTDMTGHAGSVPPEEAAAGLLARIDELTLEDSGCFRHMNGESLPW